MTHWRTVALVGVALILATVGHARAQADAQWARATMRGLPGVAVVVENLKPDPRLDGLHQADIQADVELALRLAGIRMLSEAECAVAAAQPWLWVAVNTVKRDSEGDDTCAVDIQLSQLVTLAFGSRASAASPLIVVGEATVQDGIDFLVATE